MNTDQIVDLLKKELKKQGITYRDLADRLKISEASVKRHFSEKNFPLKRLDRICRTTGIELGDILRHVQRDNLARHLSDEAELELAADDDLLLALYLILTGSSFSQLKKEFHGDAATCTRLCRRLELLGLITLLPENKIRPRVAKSVRWSSDGPLVKKHRGSIFSEFFKWDFDDKRSHHEFSTGQLSHESFKIIRRKLDDLFQAFNELSEMDNSITSKSEVFWFYSAIRPWAPRAAIYKHRQVQKE